MLEHLIVDSGAIIKGCGYEFHKTSKRFWTVQDVINEIRDSKSLHLLETLPFELEIRWDSSSVLVIYSNSGVNCNFVIVCEEKSALDIEFDL